MVSGFFGRKPWPRDNLTSEEINEFYKILKMRKNELVDEISLIASKFHFTYNEIRNFDIETRSMYIDKIVEMQKQKGPQSQIDQKFPMNVKDKTQFDQSANRVKNNKSGKN